VRDLKFGGSRGSSGGQSEIFSNNFLFINKGKF
jgi:hypothetical protein